MSNRSTPTVELEPGATDTPLYRQLVDTLRSEIQSGQYPAGQLLPTESDLRVRFGVSRHTVREALRQLRDEGLVASRQGAGTTVLSPGANEQFVHEVASINDLITYAQELIYAIESSAMVAADADLARRLDCRPGQRWLRVEGRRHPPGDDTPIAWSEMYIHPDYAGVALFLGRRPGPLYLWIEEMYSTQVQEVEQVLYGRSIPDAAAAILDAEPGAPGIEVRRRYFLTGGACALIAFTLHPAERFRHSMTLKRAKRAS